MRISDIKWALERFLDLYGDAELGDHDDGGQKCEDADEYQVRDVSCAEAGLLV